MKKVLLVLLMVGASFAGGAVVNGPGLDWAKDRLRAYLDDSIPKADDAKVADGPIEPVAVEVPESVPAAPLPKLSVLPEEQAAALARTARSAGPVETPTADAPPDLLTADEPSPGPAPLALGPDTNTKTKTTPAATPPDLRDLPDSAAPAKAIPPRGLRADASPPRRDGTVTPASLPPLDPTPPSTTVPAANAGEAEGGWGALRRRMAELGVRRYWLEGPPGGPVTFRCVVPVAGKNAVAQHFEAEAADELHAAEIVLRRVALWKATESP